MKKILLRATMALTIFLAGAVPANAPNKPSCVILIGVPADPPGTSSEPFIQFCPPSGGLK